MPEPASFATRLIIASSIVAASAAALPAAAAASTAEPPLGTTTRVSVDSAGTQGDSGSQDPVIAADGRHVVFTSSASNLVAGDTNGYRDVFVHDRSDGTTERVSMASDGTQGNGLSGAAAISADGRYVAFGSYASNLVPGDTGAVQDVFVHDRAAGTTERVSVAVDGTQGNGMSGAASISADGRYVTFSSYASDLVAGDANGVLDAFVRDRAEGVTERVSVASDGTEGDAGSAAAAISADGRYVAFSSVASNLVAGDTNTGQDVFVRDRVEGATERVSVASDGSQGDHTSEAEAISADGRHVTFLSVATNLVDGDTNTGQDVFVRDRVEGATERVSVASDGTQGDSPSFDGAMSADGRYVTFMSYASNLTSGDTNEYIDVFVHDRTVGTTERVSVASDGSQGDDRSHAPTISADGRHVAFQSYASNLVDGDTNSVLDVFVRDRLTGIRVTGVDDGASYEHGAVPAPGCEVRHAVDGSSSFAATLSTLSGERAADGLGSQTASCSYTGSDDRTMTASATFTVVDTTAPSLLAATDHTVEGTSSAGAPVVYTAPDALDAVDGPVAALCSPGSGSVFALGASTVTCTATDAAGNAASTRFTVTVVDTTAPVLTVPADQVVGATGPDGATVDYPAATADDAVDGAVAPACTPAAATVFPVGDTTVTCVATDARGNSTTGTFTVTVQGDVNAPVVRVPADITTEATSASGADVPYGTVLADDDRDGLLTASCTPASGALFPITTTTVACSSADAAGNTGTASFTVTVEDTTAPDVTVPADIDVSATSSSGEVVTFEAATATDVVDGTAPASCSHASGSLFPLGTSTVTCSATDAAGNTGQRSFTVAITYDIDATEALADLLTHDGQFAVFRVKQTVPLRFRPTGGSAGADDVVARLYLSRVSDGVAGSEVEADSTGLAADAGNTFTYDADSNTYAFNLSTRGMDAGTWQARLDLGDGVVRTVQFGLRR